MAWLGGAGFGIVVGASIGWIVAQLPNASVLQSVVAVLVALVMSTTTTMVFLWSRLRAAGEEVGYFGVGTENVLYLGILCAIGAVLHLVLGCFEPLIPMISEHRPIVLGAAGGLYGALSGVWAMTASRRVRVG